MTRTLFMVAILGLAPSAFGQATAEDWSLRAGLTGVDLADHGPGRSFRLHAGGVAALDLRLYDERNTRASGLGFDRAVARLDGWYDELWSGRLAVDLIGIDTLHGLEEAWVACQSSRALRFSAGLLQIPLGMENTVPAENLSFVGYGFAAYLTGRTDWALRIEGEFGEGLLSYDLTGAAGEGFDLNGQERGDPQLSARLVTYPLRHVDVSLPWFEPPVPLLSGLYLSTAAAWTDGYDGELDINNPLRNKLFNTGRLDADSSHFVHLGAGADWGPVRLAGETVSGSLRGLQTPAGERDLDDQITAWQASLSCMLTGERYDSRPTRQRRTRADLPARPLHGAGEAAGPGAFELALRYANGDIDRDLFRFGVTHFPISSQEFRSFTGALNWYATRNLRATVEVVRTLADQAPSTFDSDGRDTSYLLRIQYQF